MSTFKVTIPYTPKAKASVRLSKYGTYNPSNRGMLRTREFVRKQLEKNPLHHLFNGPVLAIVHYRIPAPTSLSAKKRGLQNLLPHTKKPDGDNLEKFLNDSLNGIVWTDDARIAWLLRSKSITNAKEGETIIFVRELANTQPNYDAILADITEHISLGDAYNGNT